MFDIQITIEETKYDNEGIDNQYKETTTKTIIENKLVLPDVEALDNWLDNTHLTIINLFSKEGETK